MSRRGSVSEASFADVDSDAVASLSFREAQAPTIELPNDRSSKKNTVGTDAEEEISLEELQQMRDGKTDLLGRRRGLKGERILCEVEDCFQLTNYRLIVHQEDG